MNKTYVGKYQYSYYKIYEVVEHLATCKGDIRERLLICSNNLLILDNEKVDHLPAHLKKELSLIIKEMTKFGAYNHPYFPEIQLKGSLENTLARIKNSTGEKIAKRIFYIYEELTNIPNCFEWSE